MRYWMTLLALIITAGSCGAAKKPASKAASKPSPIAAMANFMPKPLPADSKHTNAEMIKSVADFTEKLTVDVYMTKGGHDPKWDKEALNLIRTINASVLTYQTGATGKILAEQGKKAMDAGCTDPLVISCYGISLYWNRQYAESESVLQEVLPKLINSPYKKYCALKAAYNLALCKAWLAKPSQELGQACKQEMDLLLQCFQDGSYAPKDRRIALLQFKPKNDGGTWEQACMPFWRPLMDQLAKRKGLDPYFLKVAQARVLFFEGYQARGSGYANTVSEEGWKTLNKKVAAADKLLREAYKMRPELPEAPQAMISITLVGNPFGKETPRYWFDRAVAAQLDYISAYDSLINSMKPRWGGSMEQMYAFGLECAKTKRFDTDVPGCFWSVLLKLTTDLDVDMERIWSNPKTAESLNAICDEYAKARPNEADLWLARKAVGAWKVQNYADAAEIVHKLMMGPEQGAVRAIGQLNQMESDDTMTVINALAAFREPKGKELMQAQKLWKAGKLQDAMDIYQALIQSPPSNPSPNWFVSSCISRLDADISYKSKSWTKLRPDASFSGWSAFPGWRVIDDDTLLGKPEQLPNSLSLNQEFATDIEIEATFESDDPADCPDAGFRIQRFWNPYGPLIITISQSQKRVTISDYGKVYATIPIKDLQKSNLLSAKVSLYGVSVSLNGKEIGNVALLSARKTVLVGVCCTSAPSKSGVKVKGFRVRKI